MLEDECLAGQEFETFTEAYRTVAEFTEFYNKMRIHSSINYMAPEEFYKAFPANRARLLPIRV
ncbi:MAG TPA: transposase [Firmicutes bacterium]|nr:transposase [Bacillota bacterium]